MACRHTPHTPLTLATRRTLTSTFTLAFTLTGTFRSISWLRWSRWSGSVARPLWWRCRTWSASSRCSPWGRPGSRSTGSPRLARTLISALLTQTLTQTLTEVSQRGLTVAKLYQSTLRAIYALSDSLGKPCGEPMWWDLFDGKAPRSPESCQCPGSKVEPTPLLGLGAAPLHGQDPGRHLLAALPPRGSPR